MESGTGRAFNLALVVTAVVFALIRTYATASHETGPQRSDVWNVRLAPSLAENGGKGPLAPTP